MPVDTKDDQAISYEAVTTLVTRLAIQDLVQQTAALLDQEDLGGWLALFSDESEYRLTAYSTELKKEMVWWKSNRKELEKQLKEVPQHVRDPGQRFHLVSPPRVELSGNRAQAFSAFAVFRTLPSGETRFYAVGRYEDQLILNAGQWLYVSHVVRAETREFEALTHLPL
jgi:methanesulfonate monooxygenase small subunit